MSAVCCVKSTRVGGYVDETGTVKFKKKCIVGGCV